MRVSVCKTHDMHQNLLPKHRSRVAWKKVSTLVRAQRGPESGKESEALVSQEWKTCAHQPKHVGFCTWSSPRMHQATTVLAGMLASTCLLFTLPTDSHRSDTDTLQAHSITFFLYALSLMTTKGDDVMFHSIMSWIVLNRQISSWKTSPTTRVPYPHSAHSSFAPKLLLFANTLDIGSIHKWNMFAKIIIHNNLFARIIYLSQHIDPFANHLHRNIFAKSMKFACESANPYAQLQL